MTREQANEIANRLLAKYENNAADAPMGCEYHECYNAAKAVPTVEHMDMFRRIKDEIAEMGVEFLY
jgi:hypothetical protein